MTRYVHMLFILFLYMVMYSACNSREQKSKLESEKLTLISKIILPAVSGRIDHIAYDSVNHLVFIAALGNNTVEVVNTATNQVIYTIKGLQEPQGIIYLSLLKKVIVANGDNGDCTFFDAGSYKSTGNIHLKSDADNIRYNAATNLLYVGYGNGGIAVIDPQLMQHIADIELDGHPESFQISEKQNRLYVNVPDADEIEVADLSTNSVIAKWKN